MAMAACMHQVLTIRHSKCSQHCIPPDIGLATWGFYRTVALIPVCSRDHYSYIFPQFPVVGPLCLVWNLQPTRPQFSFGICQVMHSFVVCHCSSLNSLMLMLFSVMLHTTHNYVLFLADVATFIELDWFSAVGLWFIESCGVASTCNWTYIVNYYY